MKKIENETIARIFLQLIKSSILKRILIGYILSFMATSAVFFFAEPGINSYNDSLWYAFVSCSSIGFGDMVATSVIGRTFTVFLYIYTVLILAVITAVFTHLFIEVSKARNDEAVSLFRYDLEHLDELTTERHREISEKIKKIGK